MMVRLVSHTFRSIKPHQVSSKSDPVSSPSSFSDKSESSTKPWSVYLILSTNLPIKTYVGVTTDFSRRLKQHNGELKGGAKASRAGRPWVCACLIEGFDDKNKACEFESKWKNCSRKLPRKRKAADKRLDNDPLPLLQHRRTALDRVKGLMDCSGLEIFWHLNLS